MTTVHERRGALERIDRILNRGGDSESVRAAVVEVLARLFPYAAVELAGGRTTANAAAPTGAKRWPVRHEGVTVAELVVVADDRDDLELLERVALLVSPYCR